MAPSTAPYRCDSSDPEKRLCVKRIAYFVTRSTIRSHYPSLSIRVLAHRIYFPPSTPHPQGRGTPAVARCDTQ